MAENVPLFVRATYAHSTGTGAPSVYLGKKEIPPENPQMQSFWYVVLDNSTLEVKANVTSQNWDTVPPEILQYNDSSGVILIVTTFGLRTTAVPIGQLYEFLQQAGGGRALARIEQVFEQTGTGVVLQYAYALVSNLTPEPDFEGGSFTDDVILTLQLVPIEIDGKTVYSPQQPSL